MIYLISGGTHAGKTLWAQRLMEQRGWPYLSMDHVKMGLIRTGLCPLSPQSPDEEMTAFLWPVIREMIKTAVENGQNLIVEGCYLPFSWREDFLPEYLAQIRAVWLIFSRDYILNRFSDILAHAHDIERRLNDTCTREELLRDNGRLLAGCQAHACPYLLMEQHYPTSVLELEELLCSPHQCP